MSADKRSEWRFNRTAVRQHVRWLAGQFHGPVPAVLAVASAIAFTNTSAEVPSTSQNLIAENNVSVALQRASNRGITSEIAVREIGVDRGRVLETLLTVPDPPKRDSVVTFLAYLATDESVGPLTRFLESARLGASATPALSMTACPDHDGDGYGFPGNSVCAGGPSSDCNDANAAVFPGAPEQCNSVDDDCDGRIDDGFDADGDGVPTCLQDCNDSDPMIGPGMPEICDGVDNDCDASIDESFDADGDGVSACSGDCDDVDSSVHPNAIELCDRKDNDCNGLVDDDSDRDGFTACTGDCDESNPSVHPKAAEICGNDQDENCDGAINDACLDGQYWYADHDTDGFGDVARRIASGSQPKGYVSNRSDCDDTDGAVRPNAVERCNQVDDDCDGHVDNGFNVHGACVGHFPDSGTGPCSQEGQYACDPASGTSRCRVVPLFECRATEGVPGALTCGDGFDNDGDGHRDLDDSDCRAAERCDGADNDNDGAVDEDFDGLFEPCEAGIGTCRSLGVIACSPDGMSTECTAAAGTPGNEGPEGDASCTDGIDDDCDGLSDRLDPECLGLEHCDGRDNDGDGSVDEEFSNLGESCSAGVGACVTSGLIVCSPDQSGTVCNAVGAVGKPEGPGSPSCFDEIDNDCDALQDLQDPDCRSALLEATCALPYTSGRSGNDCQGWHQILFGYQHGLPNAQVKAELLAMDGNGNRLGSILVSNGDRAHLASRVNQNRITSESDRNGRRYTVFAPIPLLHVTVDDGLNKAEAFCSPIPFLDVVQQVDVVLDGVTFVEAAIPLVDPRTLVVEVDGIDVLDALDIDPVTRFPGGPFQGTASINSRNVGVSGLSVRVAESVEEASANVFTMQLMNLGCGGHVIRLRGERAAGVFPHPLGRPAAVCLVDDIRDSEISEGFEIAIASPSPGEVSNQVPTPIVGTVCHGRPIQSLRINGLPVDVSGQVLHSGNGTTSADTVTLAFNTPLERTDILSELATGKQSIGTLDHGSNRVVVDATDGQGHRVIATTVFATAPVAEVETHGSARPGATTSGVEHGFAVGVTPAAIENMLKSIVRRDSIRALIQDKIDQLLTNIPTPGTCDTEQTCEGHVRGDVCISDDDCNGGTCLDHIQTCDIPLCAPQVVVHVEDVEVAASTYDFASSVQARIEGSPSKLFLSFGLPDTTLRVVVTGHCCTDCFFCCCNSKDIDVEFTLQLSNTDCDDGNDETPRVDPATCALGWRATLEVSAEVLEGQASPILSILGPKAAPYEITRDHLDVDICGVPVEDAVVIGGILMGGFGGGLLGGVVGEAAGGIGGGIVGAYYSAIIEDFLHAHRFINPLVQDFIVDQQLVPGVVVPLKLVAPELDRDITTARVRLSSELGDVHINEFGVVANVRSEFAPTSIDACAIATPGFPLTQDPSPSFPIGPNLNSFAVVSDDLINQLSESVRRAGLLRTTYAGSNLTVGDVVDTNDPVVHLALQLAGIDAAAPLLIRSSADTSPRLLIVDDPDTQSAVEIVFRLNDVSVEMVVDRNGDGIAGRPGEECPTLHSCFSRSAPSLEDCSLFAACLDIDVSADFQVSTVASDEGPRPEILLTGVRPHPIVREPFGLVCDSPIASVGAPFLSAASGSQAIQRLFEGLELSVPPIVIKDLSLNGLVKVDHLKAIAIETNHDPSLQEYLGVAMDLEECPGSECGSELP